ncbi:MAG: dihydroorotate dehydrogenase electron transfer subunit [Muribaculum sp.]|nr:dihydroorotate dehydrogenase electron transfer subunit [Muribaculum sp.]
MKKHQLIFSVVENRPIHSLYSLLILRPVDAELPPMSPGQFVQIKVPSSQTTFLRRPISINYVDYDKQTLWLLIRRAGEGTNALCQLNTGDTIDIILPLGNGFSYTENESKLLLVGGGVGVAPMLYLGYQLQQNGFKPEFLLGARSANDILEFEEFKAIGPVHISTDDGSVGEHGLVTTNSVFDQQWDHIYCCGPAPMMKAVAAVARRIGAKCDVSLENMMACGLGACLCCVENTVKGNVCVCTEGPVFNIDDLTWQL